LKPKAHIMCATPSYTGQVETDYANALAVASMHLALRGYLLNPRFASGFSLVEYARNWLVAEFLSIKDATHLMWIDSDLFFQPDAIFRLLQRDLPVVCGVYTTKTDDLEKCIYPYTALGPEENGLQEAERVPGGFMLMTRAAVERVCEDCEWMPIEHQGETRQSPRFFDLLMKDGKLHGEDYIACARLRAAGFKIFVETDISFKHYGRKAWPANLARTLQAERESGFEGQGTKAAWDKNTREQIKLG
jgi:hypothetical protein